MTVEHLFETYSPALFNSLPSVQVAEAQLEACGGIFTIQNVLADIAAKHPNASRFGIQLLHRHSNIDEDEVMLAHSNTTVPIKRSDISEAGLERVHPTIWGVDPRTDMFAPLEFAFADDDEDIYSVPRVELEPAFASEVSALLHSRGLHTLLGLALVREGIDVGLESTFERANVIMPAEAFADVQNSIEVLWQLVPQLKEADSAKSLKLWCRQICHRMHGQHRDLGHDKVEM